MLHDVFHSLRKKINRQCYLLFLFSVMNYQKLSASLMKDHQPQWFRLLPFLLIFFSEIVVSEWIESNYNGEALPEWIGSKYTGESLSEVPFQIYKVMLAMISSF